MAKTKVTVHKDLTEAEKVTLFAWLAIDELLAERARIVLKYDQIPDKDSVLAFWLESVHEYMEKYSQMPDLSMFRSILSVDLDSSTEVDQADVDRVEQLLAMAQSAAALDKEKYYKVIQSYLSRYAEECLRLRLAESLSGSFQTADLATRLSEAHDQVVQATATDDTLFASVYDSFLDERPQGRFISLGIDFIDLYCGGSGPGTTDVLGHAGPRGGGKSTILNQVACNVAIDEQRQALQENRIPKFVYVFNYERVEDVLSHHLTYLAQVDRRTVEDFIYRNDKSIFSTGRDYKPYELKQFAYRINKAKAGNGSWPNAELERIEQARQILQTNLFVADFTGRKQAYMAYSGSYVPGIAEFIGMHQKRMGEPGVAGVFIDYAGTCVRANIAVTGKQDHERALIENLPLMCKRIIANKFATFVWVAHQLAAAEADRRPGTAPNKNAFKGSKAFAENVDFCVVNGTLTRDGFAVFAQSKARRGDQLPDTAGRLLADRCKWISAGANYVVQNNTIMTKDEANTLTGFTSKSNLREDYE